MKELFNNRTLMRLGIVGTAFLISWLAGGFPPLIWMALFQTVSRSAFTGASSPAYHAVLSSSLLILWVQSFCLLAAWSVLLWLAVREMVFVSRSLGRGQRRYTSGVHGAGGSLGNEQSVHFVLDTAGGNAGILLEELTPPVSPHCALTLPIARDDKPGDTLDAWLEPSVGAAASLHEERNVLETANAAGVQLPSEPAPPTNGYEGPRIHAQSHRGIVRAAKPNEDSYLQIAVVRQPPHAPAQWAGLFLVADGMGGHNQGKYASSLVVDAICLDLEAALRDPRQGSADLKQHFVAAVKRANVRLFQENTGADTFRGTTVTGVILLEEAAQDEFSGAPTTHVAHVVNVGDSRTYWHSVAQGFHRVTRDHSMVEHLVARHLISPEERYTHKRRNEIYRCLGEKEDIEVDVFTLALQPSDRLLLCSDGLWEMVRDAELASLLSKPADRPSYITADLIQAALRQGGKDNVTALVIMIPGTKGV